MDKAFKKGKIYSVKGDYIGFGVEMKYLGAGKYQLMDYESDNWMYPAVFSGSQEYNVYDGLRCMSEYYCYITVNGTERP